MMKRWLALLLALSLCLSLAACGQPAPVSSEPASQIEVAEEAVEDSPYPMTLVDMAGREVTLEAAPQRLVSTYYITSSLLIALGLQDKMVGIETKPERRAIYGLSAPQLLELPMVGTAKELDIEGCAAVEPDLVVLPLRLKDAAATLEELGIPVLLVNPESRELLQEAILLVAAATQTDDRAQQLLDFIYEKTDGLAAALSGAQPRTVYLASNSNLLATAGAAMYQSDMIRLAGGANVAEEITDSYWAEISYEQLLAWDPEFIILASDASYTVEDVLADPNLADCAAVVSGNVYQLPNKAEPWDSPVPGSFLGSLWLSTLLHPDLCSADDCMNTVNDYYETFYGFRYSEN